MASALDGAHTHVWRRPSIEVASIDAYDNSGDCSAGLDEYKTTYVDPFAAILAEFEGVVPVALIVEPDSLPNFATNLDDPRCGNVGTKNAYELGIAYAVEALKAAAPSAHIYLDAGHGGWLGWEDNLESFASTVASLGVEDHLRGFATNTANYQPLGEPCADGVDCIAGPGASSACCDDPCGLLSQYNRGQNEHEYALFHAAVVRYVHERDKDAIELQHLEWPHASFGHVVQLHLSLPGHHSREFLQCGLRCSGRGLLR